MCFFRSRVYPGLSGSIRVYPFGKKQGNHVPGSIDSCVFLGNHAPGSIRVYPGLSGSIYKKMLFFFNDFPMFVCFSENQGNHAPGSIEYCVFLGNHAPGSIRVYPGLSGSIK